MRQPSGTASRRPALQVLTILGRELGLKKLTVNFLQLLIVESRIDALQAVLESFETLYNQAINLQAGSTPCTPGLLRVRACAVPALLPGQGWLTRSGR